MEGVSHPPAVAMPKGVIPPGTIPAGAIPKGVLPGAPMPAPVRRPTPKPAAPATKPDIPEQRLKGDAAEVTIPHYLISWTDDKGDHTARAYEGEVKNINGNTYKAKNFRHDFPGQHRSPARHVSRLSPDSNRHPPKTRQRPPIGSLPLFAPSPPQILSS